MKIKQLIITILLSGVLFAGIGVLGTMYLTQWREPFATYSETVDPDLIKIRKDLEAYKTKLRKEGKYSCCIKNDCNWCAIYMGHCPCGYLVSENGAEKSCPDCAAAWNKKRGKIPDVDPKAIRVTTFGIYGLEKDGHHASNVEDKDHNEGTEDHH